MKTNYDTFFIFFAISASILTSFWVAKFTTLEYKQKLPAQCGEMGRELVPADTILYPKITSTIPETDSSKGANLLIDHDLETLAYPQGNALDYVIDFNELYPFHSFKIHWGEYGKDSAYINQWELLGCNSDAQWIRLSNGYSPNATTSYVETNFPVSEIHLKASSSANWIGAYELEYE